MIRSNMSLNPAYFFGTHGMDLVSPSLTYIGCSALCDNNSRWYIDAGQRVMTWLLPLLLLIGNMDVSPLDKWRYSEVITLLGNPIEFLWALLSKIETWEECFHLAKDNLAHFPGLKARELGTILGAIEEITHGQIQGHSGEPLNPYDYLSSVLFSSSSSSRNSGSEKDGNPTVHEDKHEEKASATILEVEKASPEMVELLRSAAFEIADNRYENGIRTLFAVFLYALQLVSAFVNVIGGENSSPPG